MQDLKDKVAVITGGASGIGFAIAERLAEEGMKLVLADIEPGALDRACTSLRARGARVIGVPTDVRQRQSVQALLDASLKELGAVNVLCNNAGVTHSAPTWMLTEADWQWVLGVNLWGVIHGIGVFVPHMLAQGQECHIVNTSSMGGFVSLPFMSAYQVSKHGVVTLTETLANELEQFAPNIGVSVLCPAFVKSNLHEAARNRPEDVRSQSMLDQSAQQAIHQTVSQLVNSGIAPNVVAEAVVHGIREKSLYIFTHPEAAPVVNERHDRIMAKLATS